MSWSPASGRDEIETALRRLGSQPDEAVDVAEAALLMAALDRPRVPLERYRHHLSLLTRDTADLAQGAGEATLDGRIAALNAVIRERYGYSGDALTYDDPQNANLMRVIDRRKGLPVALGILYLHAARAQGWPAEGLNFPGHFLLRLGCGSARDRRSLPRRRHAHAAGPARAAAQPRRGRGRTAPGAHRGGLQP